MVRKRWIAYVAIQDTLAIDIGIGVGKINLYRVWFLSLKPFKRFFDPCSSQEIKQLKEKKIQKIIQNILSENVAEISYTFLSCRCSCQLKDIKIKGMPSYIEKSNLFLSHLSRVEFVGQIVKKVPHSLILDTIYFLFCLLQSNTIYFRVFIFIVYIAMGKQFSFLSSVVGKNAFDSFLPSQLTYRLTCRMKSNYFPLCDIQYNTCKNIYSPIQAKT